MDLAPLRELALELNLSAHGVPATVTRPAPDDGAVDTTVIWMTVPRDEAQPVGADLTRLSPRRILAIPRADLPTVPRGSVVLAPEAIGGEIRTWRADGFDHVTPSLFYVIVVPSS